MKRIVFVLIFLCVNLNAMGLKRLCGVNLNAMGKRWQEKVDIDYREYTSKGPKAQQNDMQEDREKNGTNSQKDNKSKRTAIECLHIKHYVPVAVYYSDFGVFCEDCKIQKEKEEG